MGKTPTRGAVWVRQRRVWGEDSGGTADRGSLDQNLRETRILGVSRGPMRLGTWARQGHRGPCRLSKGFDLQTLLIFTPSIKI